MIKHLRFIHSYATTPFPNIALEELLLRSVGSEECILYLWQNRQTVVIGRNQNCWKECRQQQLEQDGGFVARRLSGGGAVYHDLGNLNFTFITTIENDDLDRQLQVIIEAVRGYGLDAQKSGRNDLVINDRKFSGNAFYRTDGRVYQHGTLLINADIDNLTKYLTVSLDKLRSKGVDSVRQRVGNLSQWNSAITVDGMRQALVKAFGTVYGLTPTEISPTALDGSQLDALAQKFASWEWRFGRPIEFTLETSTRYDWGSVHILLAVNRGRIQMATIYSDAMDAEFILQISSALENCIYQQSDIIDALKAIKTDADTAPISADIQCLLLQQFNKI